MSTDARLDESDLRERTRSLLTEAHPARVGFETFRGVQYDHGLAWVHFPKGLGGLDTSPSLQSAVDDELQKGSDGLAPRKINPIGMGMAAPTLLTYGSDEMKRTMLRRIFTGEDIWCQLFSEPGAGSDVAGLACRAVRDGDAWILNGQKAWTSFAHASRWGLLLARTNPDVTKHDGLSYFVLDMQAPGVEIRPLYQITGNAEFNEVFLHDVRIPHELMLGAEGQGWQVAITTLMNERVAIGGSARPGFGPAAPLVALWKAKEKSGLSASRQAVLRDRIVQLHIQSELLALTSLRAKAAQRGAQTPGPEGSVPKLAQAELNKRVWECSLDVIGSDSLLYEEGFEKHQGRSTSNDPLVEAKYQFLRSRANSIEGGTSEVMRNILGERVLGLPGEPRVDKNVPWKDVPRG